ncbi:MAG: aspartate dehydrogenase [Clostridia bacterium]|nr:aspartate dehydrogenase [Clostridia bacterium]
MALFRREQRIAYDPQTQEPAVRRSICTGEMTAGFIDKQTGQFTDVMRLDGQKGLDAFCRSVGTDEVRIIY